MSSRHLTAPLAALVVTCAAGTATASSAEQVRPRQGHFNGQEANGAQPVPVSFTVSPNHRKVRRFSGEGIVKSGCGNHIVGFQAPSSPMTVTKRGRFRGVETNYPQPGVRVVVVGTFTAKARARGHITVHIADVSGCDATHHFTASSTAGQSAA
jgi:hypothetical protein